MEYQDLIKNGIYSFIAGFIVTVMLGVLFGFIFKGVLGGIPLPWINVDNETIIYDTGIFIIDLIFWSFIAFLASTNKKANLFLDCIKKNIKLNFIGMTIIYSLLISAILITVIIMGAHIWAYQDAQQIIETKNLGAHKSYIKHYYLGFPFTWMNIDYDLINNTSSFDFQWEGVIYDYVIVFIILLPFIYILRDYTHKRKIKKLE